MPVSALWKDELKEARWSFTCSLCSSRATGRTWARVTSAGCLASSAHLGDPGDRSGSYREVPSAGLACRALSPGYSCGCKDRSVCAVCPYYRDKILGLPGLSFGEDGSRSGGATEEHTTASKLANEARHLNASPSRGSQGVPESKSTGPQ